MKRSPQPARMPPTALGQRLREAREKREMTRDDVIYELRQRGMPRVTNTLATWERTGNLNLVELSMLARIYELDSADLAEVLAAARAEAERIAARARQLPPAGDT